MGNDNQMNEHETLPAPSRADRESEQLSKEHFLAGEILDAEAHPRLYSLEAEFRDSAANRDYKFYVVIATFLILLVGATFFITRYIERQYHREDVNITEYQDMNLKELLDTARTEEQKLSLAQKALIKMRAERDQELGRIRQLAAQKREQILSGSESTTAKQRLVEANKTQEAEELRKTQERFSASLQQKQKEVSDLQLAVNKSKSKVAEGVSRAESTLNNFDRLHRLRMAKQKAYYENRIEETILRYNPHFRDRKLRQLTARAPRQRPRPPSVGGYHSAMVHGGISRASFGGTQSDVSDLFRLMNRLERIPFRNSTAPAVRASHANAVSVINDYERIRLRLAGAVSSYSYALDYYARIVPESGYVVDARGKTQIRVHMKPILRIKGGELASVFRSDTEAVAEIRLEEGGHNATVTSIAAGKEIRPFDRILLQAGGAGRASTSKSTSQPPAKEPSR